VKIGLHLIRIIERKLRIQIEKVVLIAIVYIRIILIKLWIVYTTYFLHNYVRKGFGNSSTNYTTHQPKTSWTRVRGFESIFNAESDAIDRFSLARHISEY